MPKRKEKDEQTTADDILDLLGLVIMAVFGLVVFRFLSENETLSQFINLDNWAGFSIIGVILLTIYCVIAYLNREVV